MKTFILLLVSLMTGGAALTILNSIIQIADAGKTPQ
jgi:hypothetical protein